MSVKIFIAMTRIRFAALSGGLTAEHIVTVSKEVIARKKLAE